jgi:hypothetical protein
MTITFALYYQCQNSSIIEFAQIYTHLTAEEADALPKSLKFASGNRMYTWNLKANGANGGINEAALKRLTKLFAIKEVQYGSFWNTGERYVAGNEVPETVARKMVGA